MSIQNRFIQTVQSQQLSSHYTKDLSRLSSHCCCCSLLYSTIIRSRENSLRSCRMRFWMNTHRNGVLTALFVCYMADARWNCCRLGTFCVHHTTMHHSTSLHANVGCVRVNCNPPPALLAEWPGSFACYCSNTGVEWIVKYVSTESWPWRRKLPHRSCRERN